MKVCALQSWVSWQGKIRVFYRPNTWFFFETNQAGELPIYIKKKIRPKWAQRYNSDQQTCRKKNSTKRKKTTSRSDWDIDTELHKPKLNSEKKKEKENHQQLQTTTLHRHPWTTKDVRAKTPSSLLAPSLLTMIHTGLAYCQVGLAAVGCCKPCSPPTIGFACAARQDDVPHRTSHRHAGLAAVARCKLPNQMHEKLPLALTKPTPSTEIQARTL